MEYKKLIKLAKKRIRATAGTTERNAPNAVRHRWCEINTVIHKALSTWLPASEIKAMAGTCSGSLLA